MNNNLYTYSLLEYRHSAVSGESLNIGLLVYFVENGSFYFHHSMKLKRIKSIYSNVSDKVIKHYLKQIEIQIEKFSNISDDLYKADLVNHFDYFISQNLLPKDESVLQFSPSRSGIQYELKKEKIINYLIKSYSLEEEEDSTESKDNYLTRKFYEKIKRELGTIDKKLFKKNYKIQNRTGVEFNFNYAWQNGNLNLVKPLNFDLKEPRFISEKTYKNYGLIVDIQDYAKEQKLHFDYLVGRPKKKELFKEYDHSINLLSSLDILDIIEEDAIDNYTHHAIDSLSKSINQEQ